MREKNADSFIMEFRSSKLSPFTLLPFVLFLRYCLHHDVDSICSVLSLARAFSLVFSSLNYYYTLCTHNNISILYTHTFFIFSSYNTLGCAFVLRCFFSLSLSRKTKRIFSFRLFCYFLDKNNAMPSMDSNSSSSYSSSESSTSSLSSPRVLLTDIVQHPPMRIPTETTLPNLSVSTTHSHGCLTRYKTELCRPFTETGKCKYGDKCQFSHGTNELRILMRHPKYKTEYCRTFHTSKTMTIFVLFCRIEFHLTSWLLPIWTTMSFHS